MTTFSEDKTYVYDGAEVKLTGRKAKKPNMAGTQFELVEVTPVDEDNGTWKKWVPRQGLFEIQ
jgi:hypothetical protein